VKRLSTSLLLLCALALPFLPGCSCASRPAPQPDPDEAEVESEPPFVEQVAIPDWPPPGPDTVISATVTDDEGLRSVAFDFENYESFTVYGTKVTVDITGAELGEGYGTLHVIAYDEDGGWTHQEVGGFLVDLSEPKGELVSGVFKRAEGVDLQAWVGDAWALGGAAVTFGGVTVSQQFEAGYPSTLGEAWDSSLITLPTMDFPEGSGKAELIVWDAAGNEASFEVDLTLDGTPPVAGIVSPAPMSTVSGLVPIEVTGIDEGTDPVQIDIYVAGTPVATLPGPSGKVTVDVSELAKGAVTIEAVAHDVAGNTGAVASIDVVIE
jgi:hypothetical protein